MNVRFVGIPKPCGFVPAPSGVPQVHGEIGQGLSYTPPPPKKKGLTQTLPETNSSHLPGSHNSIYD